MRTGIVFWLTFLLLSSSSLAEELPPWKLGVRTQIVSNNIEFKPRAPLSQSNNNLTYRPAQSNYFGIVAGWRWLSGTLWFAVPADRKIRDVEGTSKYTDIGLSLYFKKIGFELGYNSFQGFLIENSASRISSATLAGSQFYKLPDMKTTGFGAKVLIPTNPERFSMLAAFEQSEIQNQSGGSWVWIFAARYQRATSPSPIIPTEWASAYGGDASLTHVYMMNGSGGIGYGYNWVPSSFFVSPFLGMGLGYQSTRWSSSTGDHHNDSVTANLYLKLSMGWNAKKYFLTGNFTLDRFQQNTDSIEIGNMPATLTLSLGARF